MSDETQVRNGDGAAAPPMEAVTEQISDDDLEREQKRLWAAEDTGQVKLPFRGQMAVASSRVSAPSPTPLISPVRVDCEHCRGVGYVPGVNDLLMESAHLIGDRGDEVVRLFYSTLLTENPALAALFPDDLVSASVNTKDSRGVAQREKLFGALVALAENYDPGDAEKMERLTHALTRFGRHHAAFVRQDGTVSGATLEEYAAVKQALFSTLVRVLADQWRPEYGAAWSQAFDYATAIMLAEQFRSGFVAPRFARA